MTTSTASLTGERIAVAGGSGFIGRVLVSRLIATGASVTLITRKSAAALRPGLPHLPLEDLRSADFGCHFERGAFDRVFNLAGYGVDPSARESAGMVDVNVALAVRLAEAAARCGAKAFVQAGSNSEYLDTGSQAPREEGDPLETLKVYGASKAAGSLVVQAVAARTGLPLVVARLFNIYGPGEAHWRLLPSLHRALSAGTRVALSAGTQVRDFLHVEDAAAGLIALSDAAQKPGGPAVINLCSGRGASVRAFAEGVARSIGADETLLGFGDLPMRPDDVPYLVGSVERLHAATQWRPIYTLEEGLRSSVRALETT